MTFKVGDTVNIKEEAWQRFLSEIGATNEPNPSPLTVMKAVHSRDPIRSIGSEQMEYLHSRSRYLLQYIGGGIRLNINLPYWEWEEWELELTSACAQCILSYWGKCSSCSIAEEIDKEILAEIDEAASRIASCNTCKDAGIFSPLCSNCVLNQIADEDLYKTLDALQTSDVIPSVKEPAIQRTQEHLFSDKPEDSIFSTFNGYEKNPIEELHRAIEESYLIPSVSSIFVPMVSPEEVKSLTINGFELREGDKLHCTCEYVVKLRPVHDLNGNHLPNHPDNSFDFFITFSKECPVHFRAALKAEESAKEQNTEHKCPCLGTCCESPQIETPEHSCQTDEYLCIGCCAKHCKNCGKICNYATC